MRFPVVEIQHRNRIRSRRRLVAGHKHPSHRRPHAEHVEVVAAHHLRADPIGAVVPRHPHVHRRRSNQPAEHGVLLAQVLVHRIRERMDVARRITSMGFSVPLRRPCEAQHDELAGILYRQRLHQRLIQQAEDRRVRPDRQRQGQHRDRRKHRIPRQPARPVLHIAPHRFHRPSRTLFAALLPRPLPAPKRNRCLPPCLFRCHPARHILLRLPLQMKRDLLIHLAPPLPREEELRPRPDLADHRCPFSYRLPATGYRLHIRSSTRFTAPVSRSQFSISASSCFRPAAVSE